MTLADLGEVSWSVEQLKDNIKKDYSKKYGRWPTAEELKALMPEAQPQPNSKKSRQLLVPVLASCA